MQPAFDGKHPNGRLVISSELPRHGYAREPAVLRVVPFSRSTLWSKAKSGAFPKPVKLSERVTAWRCEDVWAWMDHKQAKAP
jgi:predicted DNA-binding transcriptional regulator AlpA